MLAPLIPGSPKPRPFAESVLGQERERVIGDQAYDSDPLDAALQE